MKAILIDPVSKTIKEVDYNGKLEHLYKLLDVTIVEAIFIDDNEAMYVDEEGLLKANQSFFLFGRTKNNLIGPLAGKALVVGMDAKGNDVNTDLSVATVTEWVHFDAE